MVSQYKYGTMRMFDYVLGQSIELSDEDIKPNAIVEAWAETRCPECNRENHYNLVIENRKLVAANFREFFED